MPRHEWRVTYRRKGNRFAQHRIFGLWPKARGFMDGLLESRDVSDIPVIEMELSKRLVGRWERVRHWEADPPLADPEFDGLLIDMRSRVRNFTQDFTDGETG